MPYSTFNFAPGLNKDDSPLASEGGWIDGNHVRFASGRPQTIGGWDFVTSDSFAGIVRGSHAWADQSGRRYVAFGTASTLYLLNGGSVVDITPPHSEGVLSNPFTTVNSSAIVTVTQLAHNFSTGMTVQFSNQSAPVGGLTLAGDYDVTVIDDDTYTVVAASNATSSATGGGFVDYTASLPAGLVDGAGEPGGYGTGAYGEGGYGDTDLLDYLPQVWFLQSWGETLLALPRGGALYQFQPAPTYPELCGNGDFASSAGWVLGTGWSVAGAANAAAGTASDLSRAIDFRPGYVYRVEFGVTVSAGTVSVQTSAGTIGGASSAISVSGSYSRRFRAQAGAAGIVFHKDAAFAGSIDNVSVKLESIAYRVDEAPARNASMFVDQHQIAVLLGTAAYGESWNSMTLRWCDRQDITSWTPDVSNLAGDETLAAGSRLVSGISTARQNVLWSDVAAYVMQFTGDATAPFRFDLIGSGCGIVGPLACAEHDGVVYWLGASKNFYRFVGATPEIIPSTLRRDVFDNIAPNQQDKICCGVLPSYSEWWVFYPDMRDGNECSRYAAWRWDEQNWTAGVFGRSSWIDPGIFEYPIAFGTDGRIYFHEVGDTAAGGVIDWYVESAFFDIGEGDNLMLVRRIVGDFDDLRGPVDFTLYGRLWPADAATSYGPFQHTASTRKLDMLLTARQLKFRMSAAASPAFMRLGALRIDLQPTGMRE